MHPNASDTAEHLIEFCVRVDIRFVVEIENVNLERTRHISVQFHSSSDMRAFQLT